jgi:hemerythrin-like domain-containing protein
MPMDQIPYVLEPLAEIRRQLFTILDLLEQNDDPVVRADLASELVGAGSRYEDVKARVIYPALERLVGDEQELVRGDEERRAVRQALTEIRKRTRNVKPLNAHLEDPEGFEAALEELVSRIRSHVEHEDEILFPALAGLGAEDRRRVRSEVADGVAHASTYPNPPKHLVGRALVSVLEKLERGPQGESDSYHPGVELLDEALNGNGSSSS